MGYMTVITQCAGCRKRMTCHPLYVPSIRFTPDGPREPLCRACAEFVNTRRRRQGLEPTPIHPRAYDVAEEGE